MEKGTEHDPGRRTGVAARTLIAVKNLMGIPLKRKAPDPKTEEAARLKRVRKAEVVRANRAHGAFDSYREPRRR